MKSTSILDLMIKDHKHLFQKLNDIEDIKDRDISYITKKFNDFRWNLEKHFFVEERAIFTFYNPEKIDEGYDVFSDISKQHTNILEKIETMNKKLENWEPFDLTEIKGLLNKHRQFEENNVYPKLDREISDGEKRFMIERIEEVSL